MENSQIIELSIKIIGGIAALFGIWKLYTEQGGNKKKRYREEYEFSKQFFNDLGRESSLVVEMGHRAIFGFPIQRQEADHLLAFDNPLKAIDFVASTFHFIEFTSNGSYDYKEKYKKTYRLWISKAWHMSSYGILMVLGLLPYAFWSKIQSLNPVALLIFTISFVGFAMHHLFVFRSIYRSKYLIENQPNQAVVTTPGAAAPSVVTP